MKRVVGGLEIAPAAWAIGYTNGERAATGGKLLLGGGVAVSASHG